MAKFLEYAAGWKPHFCTDAVVTAVLMSLEKRGAKLKAMRSSGANMERGWGMQLVGTPYTTVKIEDQSIGFPCYEIDDFIAGLDRAMVRVRAGTTNDSFVKVHGYLNCFCLTLDEAVKLRASLIKSRSRIKRRDKAFGAAWDKAHAPIKNGAPTATIVGGR